MKPINKLARTACASRDRVSCMVATSVHSLLSSFAFPCARLCQFSCRPRHRVAVERAYCHPPDRDAGKTRAAPKLTCHFRPRTFAGADLAYHGAHFAELVQELVDVLRSHAAACRDTLAPAAVDNIRIATFFSSH